MTDASSVLKTMKDEDVEYLDLRFVDPRGKLVARPTPVASQAEAGMVVEEIERLDKEGAGVMVGHGGVLRCADP